MMRATAGALGGLGYISFSPADSATPVGFGGALRGYPGSRKHRAALEASLSLLAIESTSIGFVTTTSRQHYGPGLSATWRR
jgi:hypothetical protein